MKQNCVSVFLEENGCGDFFRELNLARRSVEEEAKRSALKIGRLEQALGVVT
jgi:hypothetical protein